MKIKLVNKKPIINGNNLFLKENIYIEKYKKLKIVNKWLIIGIIMEFISLTTILLLYYKII